MAQISLQKEPGKFEFAEGLSKAEQAATGLKRRLIPVEVTRVSCESPRAVAFVYTTKLNSDKDGAPNAYGRPGPGIQAGKKGIDNMGNATNNPHHWKTSNGDFHWTGIYAVTQRFAAAHGLLIDTDPELCARQLGKKSHPHTDGYLADENVKEVGRFPVIQTVGATAGYYVSPNNFIKDPSKKRWEQARYGDPMTVAFAVRTGCWEGLGRNVKIGILGWSVNARNGNAVSFVFGDSNSSTHVGECSWYMKNQLCGRASEQPAMFIVFDGLSGGSMQTLNQSSMDSRVRSQLKLLLGADNGMEFALFLATGGSLEKFNSGQPRQINWTGMNTLRALSRMGFQVSAEDLGATTGPRANP